MHATILRSIGDEQRFGWKPLQFLQSDRNSMQSSLNKIPKFNVHNS